MGSVTTAAEQDSMWYEYEPLLTSPVRMTCSPERLPNPFPQAYPSFATNSHSGPMNYPSYRAYLGGMVDYDYSTRDINIVSLLLSTGRHPSPPFLSGSTSDGQNNGEDGRNNQRTQ